MRIKKKAKSDNICLPEAEKGVLRSRKTKINLWIDAEMYRLLKVEAAKEEITVTSILCAGAKKYLEKKEVKIGH